MNNLPTAEDFLKSLVPIGELSNEHAIEAMTEYAKLCVEAALKEKAQQIKEAFTAYVKSEGCSCCSNEVKHKEAGDKIGELLGYEKYSDNSGYDFYKTKQD